MNFLHGLTALTVFCCFGKIAQAQSDTLILSHPDSSRVISPMFRNFACNLKENNRVLIQWEVDSIAEGDYFVIERSNENAPFEAIGAVRASLLDTHYELSDSGPPNGANFYRVRYSGKTEYPVSYSNALFVNVMGELDFKFYPNPVDKLFIVRTEHLIDIQIIDAFGAVRLSKRLQKGIQVVNIASLERGAYVLRVADKESNRIVSNQLLKN